MNRTDFYDQEQEQGHARAVVRRRHLTLVPDLEERALAVPSPAAFIASVTELAARTAARTVAEQAAPAHPGINVRVPGVEAARPAPRSRRLFTRAELIGYCGISAGATAAAGGIVAIVTGSFMPLGVACVGGMLTSFGAAIASCRDDDRRVLRATAHLTGGEQR